MPCSDGKAPAGFVRQVSSPPRPQQKENETEIIQMRDTYGGSPLEHACISESDDVVFAILRHRGLPIGHLFE